MKLIASIFFTTTSVFWHSAVLLLLLGPSSLLAANNWDLNDVTILYPLPDATIKDLNETNMIAFTDSETGVQFFDTAHILYRYNSQTSSQELGSGPFVFDTKPDLKMLPNIRVLGIRFDPCSRDTFSSPCQRQIRFTWQPVMFYPDHWIARDTAFHSFYNLSDKEWTSFLEELDQLRAPYISFTKGLPLQPHPVLVQEGLKGPFSLGLKQLLVKYVGNRKASRVTHMNIIGEDHLDGEPTTVWDFRMTQLLPSALYSDLFNPSVLASGADGEKGFESIQNSSPDGKEFNAKMSDGYVIGSIKTGVENIINFVKDSALFKKQATHSDEIAMFQTALRIQQPSMHLAMTTDCVSCHMSTASQVWFERNLPKDKSIQVEAQFRALWKGSGFNLHNISPRYGSTRSVRALGYLASEPAISNRVIFESATVAKQLNKYEAIGQKHVAETGNN